MVSLIQNLFKPILSDIRDINLMDSVFSEFRPQIVFHAAAYKHVPMQEKFPGRPQKLMLMVLQIFRFQRYRLKNLYLLVLIKLLNLCNGLYKKTS